MSTLATQMKRFGASSLTTLMITAILVATASAAAVNWTGGSGSHLYWLNPNNWDPAAAAPTSADDVTFTSAGAQPYTIPPTVTNEVNSNITINSLTCAPTINVHTTKIDSGMLLSIQGIVAAPSAADGPVSFWAGAPSAGADDISQSLFTGGGRMEIADASGGNTGGDIVVRQTNAVTGPHNSILDMSGLASFSANVDQLLVAYTPVNDPDRPCGTMYMAQTNTITLNNTGMITYHGNSPSTIDGGLILGFAGNHVSPQGPNLYLGQTNTINVATVYVGARRETAYMRFNPAYVGTSATLKMRGIDGTSRVATISIGDNTGNGTGATSVADGTLDLSGGVVDITVSTLVMGTSTAASATNISHGARGTLTFNGGTIDATTIILGNMVNDLNTNRDTIGDSGTLNLNGTANLIVGSGGITLGKGPSGGIAAGRSQGMLNIRDTATVTMGADIQAGGVPISETAGSYSTISLSGGTLDMQGHNIGSSMRPITTLNLNSGTLKNVHQINGAAGISKTSAGILVIDGVNTYGGITTVAEGTLLAEGSLTSPISVNNGATLGGKGFIGGLTVASGGLLSIGDSPGRLTATGNVSFGGTDAVEINGASPGIGYDQLVVNDTAAAPSTVTISGILQVSVSAAYAPVAGDEFWILANNTTTNLRGTFDTISGLPAGWSVLYNVDYGANNLTLGSGNDVAIVAVPEPGVSLLLIVVAGLCLLLRRTGNTE
jgi:autotransporter-associated beta strand protein